MMEFSDLELKNFFKEYKDNKEKIKELIKSKEILTDKGQRKYNKIIDRQHKIKSILSKYHLTIE